MAVAQSTFRGIHQEPELLVRATSDDYAVATQGNCVHLHWRREIVPEAIDDLGRAMEALVERSGGQPFGFMTTADLGCSSVSPPEERIALARLLKAQERNIAGAAIVFEETGFRATLIRSAVTAIALLSKSEFPYKVFSMVPPAATWLAARPGVEVRAASMLTAVARLRGPGHWKLSASAS